VNESAFYKLLAKTSSNLYLKRVETKTKDGFPDIVYINNFSSREGLMELKAKSRMPKSIQATGLEPEQMVFLHEWAKNGGNAYLLCGIGPLEKALLWQGRDVLAAWKSKSLGKHQEILFSSLGLLSQIIR
jgi:hypothetical protein